MNTHTLYIWILLNFSATQWPNEILSHSTSTLNNTYISQPGPDLHFNILFNTVTNKKEVFLSILTLKNDCTLVILNNLHDLSKTCELRWCTFRGHLKIKHYLHCSIMNLSRDQTIHQNTVKLNRILHLNAWAQVELLNTIITSFIKLI